LAILELDDSIRFAGIASMDRGSAGKIFAAEYRKGVAPLLTIEESELAIMQAIIKMSMRSAPEEKIGKTIYSTTIYEKVKRADIIIYAKENNKGNALLMVSFEEEVDHEAIITKKILPFLNKKIGKNDLSYTHESAA
jgi:hypothetical protein